METPKYKTALIVGAGEGLSASLARLFAKQGIRVALAARKIEKLGSKNSARSAQRPALAPLPATPPSLKRSSGCSAWSSARSERLMLWFTTPAGGRAAPSSSW
jgi:NAD(P)-dependent dehydrogenase (short-subunit alcohol dehydrogenase family)